MILDKSVSPAEVFQQPLFGLIVEDDTLEPHYKKSDILIVATQVTAIPGDLVVMQTPDAPGSPSRYDCMRLNADGDLYDNQANHIPKGAYSIVGVILDCHRAKPRP